jgi:arylsulfatase A-like enzyme
VILAGAGVKENLRLEGASILDLTPTILHAIGVPVPKELDGRVLSEVFDAGYRPVAYSEASIYKDEVSAPDLSGEEMEEVQEKLRGWGYAG